MRNAVQTVTSVAYVARMVEHSRRTYCMPVSVGHAAIEASRNAHIRRLKMESVVLDEASRSLLAEAGITTIQEFLATPAEARLAHLSNLKVSDRVRLRALMARSE
jgi:hypothetical protein